MGSKFNVDNLELILELINKACKVERVEDFLRKAKETDKNIKVSGSKDEIVFLSVKEAMRASEELMQQGLEMLCDSEESGQQHIFLFYPTEEAVRARLSNASHVAERIWGSNWQDSTNFPRILARPTGEHWADFRIGPTGTLGDSWTAKLYSGTFRWESQGKVATDSETKIETWKQRLSRDVFLIRWHAVGVLELRVPQEPTRKALFETLNGLWKNIERVAEQSEFEKLDLNPACMRLIEGHQDHTDLCRLGDSRFQDEQRGSARFAPPPKDHLMSSVTREQAVGLYKFCNELVVTWYLNKESHDTQEELRTIVGKFGTNHIHVRAKTTGKAIQHVTDQLRQLASDAANSKADA